VRGFGKARTGERQPIPIPEENREAHPREGQTIFYPMYHPRRDLITPTHRWSFWSFRRASVVHILIALNVACFLLSWGISLFAPHLVENLFALTRHGLAQGRLWQLVTYMFLHGGAIHLLVNCVGLLFAGREVETVLGKKHLLLIYFLGGILGGIAQLIAGPRTIELIGASGGVCAVLLAFTTLLPELEITALLYFVIPVKMKAKWLGRIIIGVSILFALSNWSRGVAHVAHLGGALTGLLYTRRLGYGGAFFFQRFLQDRRGRRTRREQMDSETFISTEIDPILDKIAREGIHSLSRAERRILEQGREKIARRTTRTTSR